jgi:hypothetical protein
MKNWLSRLVWGRPKPNPKRDHPLSYLQDRGIKETPPIRKHLCGNKFIVTQR